MLNFTIFVFYNIGNYYFMFMVRSHSLITKLLVNFLALLRSLRSGCFGTSTQLNGNRNHRLICGLKRKALNLNGAPLARVPPFYCRKCGLSSRYLRILTSHICSKKMATFSEYTDCKPILW